MLLMISMSCFKSAPETVFILRSGECIKLLTLAITDQGFVWRLSKGLCWTCCNASATNTHNPNMLKLKCSLSTQMFNKKIYRWFILYSFKVFLIGAPIEWTGTLSTTSGEREREIRVSETNIYKLVLKSNDHNIR